MSISAPLKAAFRHRCGACGEGKLYDSFLKLKAKCEHCGQDFTIADTADGPAFFVGFGVIVLFAPFYFILPIASILVFAKAIGYALVLAATAGTTLWLLPLAKAVLFNLQIHHRAEQAQFDNQEPTQGP